MPLTAQQTRDYIAAQLVAQVTIAKELNSFNAVIDLISQSITSGIPTWTSALTFNSDGTGAGAYCVYTDVSGATRFWKSIGMGNINHQPPTSVSITSDAYWTEVSPATGSGIKDWAAGLYGTGLIIVHYNNNLYKLANPTRPYLSSNIVTEIGTGDWVLISSFSSGLYAPASVNVATAPIILDSNLYSDILFNGSAAISANKTLQFNNDGNGRRKKFLFTITGTPVLTLPSNCKMTGAQGGWDGTTKQLDFGIIGAGDYELDFIWNAVGSYFKTTLSGPY